MARRGAIAVEITEGAIRVRFDERRLTIKPASSIAAAPVDSGAAAVETFGAAAAPDFVVALDDIMYWDAPNDAEEIDINLMPRVLDAIERECARHGLTVAFD